MSSGDSSCPLFLGETSPFPDEHGPVLGDAKSIFFLRRFGPSRRDGACLVPFYLARLAGFLPAVLPGTIEGAELVAGGLGLTALGFLASRLLRFWLLAMSFSASVDELYNPDLNQQRKTGDRCMPAFFTCLDDGVFRLLLRWLRWPITTIRFGHRCWTGHVATGLPLFLRE